MFYRILCLVSNLFLRALDIAKAKPINANKDYCLFGALYNDSRKHVKILLVDIV